MQWVKYWSLENKMLSQRVLWNKQNSLASGSQPEGCARWTRFVMWEDKALGAMSTAKVVRMEAEEGSSNKVMFKTRFCICFRFHFIFWFFTMWFVYCFLIHSSSRTLTDLILISMRLNFNQWPSTFTTNIHLTLFLILPC